MTLGAGHQFAGYTVVRLVGAGGMGEVFLAQHPRLPGRRDALKLLGRDISSDAKFRERFLREANLASTLSHQHIVGVTGRGEYEGRLWIAIDYIDGEDAAELLRRRFPAGMPAGLVAAIVTAVGSALDYAHSEGCCTATSSRPTSCYPMPRIPRNGGSCLRTSGSPAPSTMSVTLMLS
jgi:serine/threonine-protein kinase